MSDPLLERLGIDPQDPLLHLATHNADQDYRLLFSLIRMRRDRGLTQQDVADKMGVTQATVSAFEKMDADPKLSTIQRYAMAIGARYTHHAELDSAVTVDDAPEQKAA